MAFAADPGSYAFCANARTARGDARPCSGQIAAAVHRLFRECVQGNHSGVELLRQRYPAARAAAVAALQQSAADPAVRPCGAAEFWAWTAR